MTDADVIVVGLGAFGSMAAWRLAARGVTVLGFERHSIGHDQGSSHGSTRLFRSACVEHPDLAPLAKLSMDLYRELEASTGADLAAVTGGVMIGHADGSLVTKTLESAAINHLPHEVIDARQLQERFPQHRNLGDGVVGVLDPGAGILRPERTIRAACAAASAAGATIFEQAAIREIVVERGGVTVSTSQRSFRADQVIVTVGAWLPSFHGELPVEASRIPMLWFDPRDGEDPATFDHERFPVFYREISEGHRLWGHGCFEGTRIKVGPVGDPTRDRSTIADSVDRAVSPADWAYVTSMTRDALPGLALTPTKIHPCMTTNTPDGQFLVGRLRGTRTLVAGGCNAHGFKHSGAIGELLAREVIGEHAPVDARFIDPNRFAQAG